MQAPQWAAVPSQLRAFETFDFASMTKSDHARCADLLTALNYMSSPAALAVALSRPRASAEARAAGDALRPLHNICRLMSAALVDVECRGGVQGLEIGGMSGSRLSGSQFGSAAHCPAPHREAAEFLVKRMKPRISPAQVHRKA